MPSIILTSCRRLPVSHIKLICAFKIVTLPLQLVIKHVAFLEAMLRKIKQVKATSCNRLDLYTVSHSLFPGREEYSSGTVVQSEKHRELRSGHGSGQKVRLYAGSRRNARTSSEHCLGTLEHGTEPPNAQMGPCNKLVKCARFFVTFNFVWWQMTYITG